MRAKISSKYRLTLPEKIEMIKMSVRAVTRGYKMSRLVIGVPGIGKSKATLDALEDEGAKIVLIQGGIKNARTMYTTLYDNNDKAIIIVFDDVNSIFMNKDTAEILRIAVSNDKVRRITYNDNNMAKLRGLYEPSFEFKSKVIMITNVPKGRIDKAILSRTSAIEITASKKEIADYVFQNMEAAPPEQIPLKWKKDIFEFITSELKLANVARFDFRVFEDCCLWYAANVSKNGRVSPDWKKHVTTILT